VLYCVVLCCVVSRCVVLCCVTLRCVVLRCVVLCYVVLRCVVSVVLCCVLRAAKPAIAVGCNWLTEVWRNQPGILSL